jgi:hypothetical protein
MLIASPWLMFATTLPAAHQRSPADCPRSIYTTLTTDVNTIYTCPITPTTQIKPDAYAGPLLSAAASIRRYVGTDLYVVAATAEAGDGW